MPSAAQAENARENAVESALDDALSDKYERLRVVGKGAYGQVWLLKRKSDEKHCVAKVMGTEKMHRYKQEIECLANCQHPNVVRLVGAHETTVGCVIVLEFADAGDLSVFLRHHIQAKKRETGATHVTPAMLLHERQVGSIFIQLVLAVNHIHSKRMLHRDIKSANVLLCTNGIVKISDFGFSRQFDHTVSEDVDGTFLGTPYYLAPELWKRQRYSSKADVWSLGIILYEMLTLQRPFVSGTIRGLEKAIKAGHYERPSEQRYSAGMLGLLSSMLAVSPQERASTSDILRSETGAQLVEKLLSDVAENAEIDAATKEQFTKTVRDQINSLGSTPDDVESDLPSPRRSPRTVVREGAVKIGCATSWRVRYLVVAADELIVKRRREDTQCERIPFATVAKVNPYTGSEPAAEHVTVVTLKNKFSVWVKSEDDVDRDRWNAAISEALAAFRAKEEQPAPAA